MSIFTMTLVRLRDPLHRMECNKYTQTLKFELSYLRQRLYTTAIYHTTIDTIINIDILIDMTFF